MIIVKVELHSAVTREVKQLAEMRITNDGTGTKSRGNYWGNVFFKSKAAKPKEGFVRDYPRLTKHVWNLVAQMLTDMGYK